jgi:hypothetical protein
MTDATTRFFDGLSRRRHEPLLARVVGTAQFEITNNGDTNDGDAEHWYLRIDKGDLEVSREPVQADCVIRVGRDQLNDLVTGKENAMAELLRGALVVEGDPELLVLVQRLFVRQSDQDVETEREGSRR